MRLISQSKILIILIITLLSHTPPGFAAADYSREQRWAKEILPSLMVGEPIYLTQANKHRFLCLYAKAESDPEHPVKAKTAIIIVHGMGVHPNWGIYSVIRGHLFDLGYTTFSIQMPVKAADAKPEEYVALFPEAVERLQIATGYLKSQGYAQIIIVSHSNGSRMTRRYMLSNPSQINAWIALSLTRGDTFAAVRAPILDIYGEHDLEHVLASVKARKQSLGNSSSKQVQIANTDHFYNGQEERLLSLIDDYVSYILGR